MDLLKKTVFILLLLALPASVIIAQNGKTKTKTSKKSSKKKKEAPAKKAREISWFQGTEPDFEDSVKKWHKPAFLYIYLDNGDASPAFNNQVLLDTNIIKFVDSNFVAYRCNLEYDSPNAMKFMIDDVPAVILFNRNRVEIDRFEGIKSKQEFRKFLQKALK